MKTTALAHLSDTEKNAVTTFVRDIRKQWKRNHVRFSTADEDIPVYPTIASQFNDPGISWMFSRLCHSLAAKLDLDAGKWTPDIDVSEREPRAMAVIPGGRIRYLAEDKIGARFWGNPYIQNRFDGIVKQVVSDGLSPYEAANRLVETLRIDEEDHK